MGGSSPEKLFLLEFLIDKVTLKEADAKLFEQDEFLSLLVTFKIEDFLCLDINQDAMKREETRFGVTWHFCSGKSCTFAMQPRKLLNLLKNHPCYFIVGVKSYRDDTSTIMGACKANICCDLCDVILKAEFKCDKFPLTSAIHQDTHNLRSPLGDDVGFVSVLVRLTCYGQTVFTRFTRVGGDQKVYMYENKDPEPCAGMETNEEGGESLEFIDSDNALEIFGEGDKYTCQFDPDATGFDVADQATQQEETPVDAPITIVCTNIEEVLPESSFQRRFPDDTVPVAPLLSQLDDEQIYDCQQCNCLREMQLNQICRTMFLCDRSSICQTKETSEELGDAEAEQQIGDAVKLDGAVYHPLNPPIRYDTTSCLTAAYGGKRPVPLNALVEVEDEKKGLPNPPVRYNTTGALSPAFKGAAAPPPPPPPHPPVEEQESVESSSTGDYDETELIYPPAQYGTSSVTCRCWCTCYAQMSEESIPTGPFYPLNPPIRYDTTGALTAAFGGHRPVPLNALVEVEDEKKRLPNPPVRYDTTGALSPIHQLYVKQALAARKKAKEKGGLSVCLNTRFVIPIPSVAFPNVLTAPWKKNWRWYYKMGEKHPGFKEGHSKCVPQSIHVSEDVGWLWKMHCLPGWKPGILNKTLKRMFIDLHRVGGIEDRYAQVKSSTPKPKAKGKGMRKAAAGGGGGGEAAEKAKKVISKVSPVAAQGDDQAADKKVKKKSRQSIFGADIQLPPTLHIHEQDGNYYIAMQPVNLYPENINIPLQFRIPIPKSKLEPEESVSSSSELQLDYQAPAIYWPTKPKTKAMEIQCDSTEFPNSPDSPSIQVLMKPKPNGGNKNKKGKPGKGNSPVVSWDKDPTTAVGKVR